MKPFLPMALLAWQLMAAPAPAQIPMEYVIESIPVRLQGVSPGMEVASRQVLETQIALANDTSVSAPLADDLAFFLQQRYLQSGYPEALVDWRLEGKAAALLVQEGPHRTVGSISFRGVTPTQEDELRPYVTRQTREREGRLAKSLPFVEADLQDGVQFVVRKLQAEGYLQASANPPVYSINPGSGNTDILIPLVPGSISTFGAVRLSGDPGPLSEEARTKLDELAGQPYSEVRLENLRKEIAGDLQSRGWYAAVVEASAPRSGQTAGTFPANFRISPGAPFRIVEVRTVPGLGRGARRVANSVFGAATGDIYSPGDLDLLHRRALDTGIFSRLDVEPVVLGPDTMALSIKGEEAKPRTLGFFGGYETFYGPIAGVEARHVNLWDTGNALGLRAEIRGTGTNGSIQWTDPAIFGSRNSFSLALARETFTFRDYERATLSLRPRLTRRINRNISAEMFANASLSEAESNLLTPAELGPEEYQTTSAGARLVFDYRNNPLNPRSGWLAGASIEGGANEGDGEGGDFSFLRTELNAAWYYPISDSWRLAIGARGASMNASETVGEVPIDLRVFNGGATTVRSFAEREMGEFSKKGDTPLGGLAMSVVNLEVSYQIINNLEIAGFADAGSLSREDASLFSFDDIRYAIGMGIRYQLPIGPLRVDYGFNPDRQEGESAGALHVTFGFAF